MFLDEKSAEAVLYYILYGASGMAALIAAIYLLLRRGNAFAADVTPPLRLRRWGASFFVAAALSHLWWYLFSTFRGEFLSVAHVLLAQFDCLALQTTIVGTMFAMLQDHRRPVWPVVVAMLPFLVLGGMIMVSPSLRLMYIAIGYLISIFVIFTIYMIIAIRQYNRWLCDNYADLENKSVWLSQLVIIGIMLMFIIYAFDNGNLIRGYVMAFTDLVLFGLLLWRIETLPQLTDTPSDQASGAPMSESSGVDSAPPVSDVLSAAAAEVVEASEAVSPVEATRVITPGIDPAVIEQLLADRCVATQLYLQHDLKLQQLAKALGINRSYLSRYFSDQGTNYNTYINDLRIHHFIDRYREAISDDQPVIAQQLASESGYHSYSTFSLAFKQRMGQSVTAWMCEAGAEKP